MAGRMGNQQATVKNLMVLDVTADGVILIKGLVPGPLNNLVVVKKVGESKKFVPLYKEEIEAPVQPEVKTAVEEVKTPVEEVKTAENVQTSEEVQTPTEEKSGEAGSSSAEKEEVKEENAS